MKRENKLLYIVIFVCCVMLGQMAVGVYKLLKYRSNTVYDYYDGDPEEIRECVEMWEIWRKSV